MPSPFPGMDPWLERAGVFPDLHDRFLAHFAEALNAVLPPPFYAALSTRVWLEESGRRVVPDVDVLTPAGAAGPGGAAVLAAPALAGMLEVASELPDDELTESVVEMYADADGEQLVTSVELLSPVNKSLLATGRDLYRAKQLELCARGVNVLEIDLLRTGTHATLVPLDALRRTGPFDYHASLRVAARRDAVFVRPFTLRDPLPTVPVPLTAGTPAVGADLQAVFARTYDAGLYTRRARYDCPCAPPLSAEQEGWARGVLAAAGVVT